ncbi:hypothetical protein BU23DRAFT_598341 [Bimuria novae-zelandiae CBS 107.79]|uniref:Uncharacterized protein n=1 Tax=Bimuria novae-zelandiae CBS 107.79 TaxID=1447943 RepID=A0A6A5VD45_9PLEO|nr:hypothetical protein BU23DRAFT_598341 [Bimuria novae-zelandiae CBS 107.79]
MSTTTQQIVTPSVSTPTPTIHLHAAHANMSDSSTSDDQAAATASSNTLDCKECGRVMAIISAEGDTEVQGSLKEGCELCQDFFEHYHTYEGVKGKFSKVQDRRDTYGPRQEALDAVHLAQMKLGNFIQSVVDWDEPDEEADGDEVNGDNNDHGEQDEQQQPEAHAEELSISGNQEAEVAPQPRRRKSSLSPQFSPGPRKRARRSRLSDGRNRRISFDPSVVFRDAESTSHRVDAEFSRKSSGYWPGRWAPPEGSEWLDTSGYSTTIVRFTGLTKRGQKWVSTKEGLVLDEEWEKTGADEDAEAENQDEPEAEDEVGVQQEPEAQVETTVPQEETPLSAGEPEVQHKNIFGGPDASDQDSAPDLEPSARADGENIRADANGSSDEDAATDELPLPAPANVQAEEKDEDEPDEEKSLHLGMDDIG